MSRSSIRWLVGVFAATSVLAPALAPAQTTLPESGGTVYIYRYKQFIGMAIKPSVYCDDVEAARMQNGRYFALRLPPGEHQLRSNDTQSGIALQIKSGEVYFIRVELATGMLKGHGRLVLTSPEQGRVEVLRLEPSDHDAVRDTARVLLNPFAMRPEKGASGGAPTTLTRASAPQPSTDPGRALTNSDIVALVQAGLGDKVIVTKIHTSRASYSLDPEGLVDLKKNGVSDAVISAMLETSEIGSRDSNRPK